MSIETQANFWLRNITAADTEAIRRECGFDDGIIGALNSFTILLRGIYTDYTSFEVSSAGHVPTKIGIMADDLENYHNLTDTLDCLYAIVRTGVLRTQGAVSFLEVKKADLKAQFRKNAALPFGILEKNSFYPEFYRNGKKVPTYRQCNEFCVHYEDSDTMLSALKQFVMRITPKNVKEDYAPEKVLFYTADYESVFLGKTTLRREICHQRLGIDSTLGTQCELWRHICGVIQENLELGYDVCINPYVFPNWNFKFIKKRKTVCTFDIGVDRLSVRLPLPYNLAKELILSREKLPESIRGCIENFGCTCCGKCSGQSNLELVDGITLCSLNYSNFVTEDSRMISIQIRTQDEADTVAGLIRRIAG